MEQRTCLSCQDALKGRKDQKFCSDYCRNSYNNQRNEIDNKQIRKINSILKKNWKILAQLNPNGKATTDELSLAEAGFNFHYFTNIYKTQKGASYYFVYDYGYLPIENGQYVLVRKQEYVK